MSWEEKFELLKVEIENELKSTENYEVSLFRLEEYANKLEGCGDE